MLSVETQCVCLYVFEKKAGVTSAGEQMVEENLEDACYLPVKVSTTQMRFLPELCLPLLFPVIPTLL